MIPFTPENYVKNIEEDLCRWIEDRGEDGDFICMCARMKNSPYCEEHHGKAYIKPKKNWIT